MNQKKTKVKDDIRPEYDLDYSKARRGNYLQRLLKDGSNVVVLDPDVADAFRDSAAVNEALRYLLEVAKMAQANGAKTPRAQKARRPAIKA